MNEIEAMNRRDLLLKRTRRRQIAQGREVDEELEALRLRIASANDLLTVLEGQLPGMVNSILGNANPSPEANTAKPGTAMKAARNDHTHERLSATFAGTLSATTAEATILFTRTFAKVPALSAIAIEAADNGPITFKAIRWLKPNGDPWADGQGALIGGVQLYGYRDRANPTLAQVGVLALLGGVITGLNNALALLSGRKNWEPAVNAPFSGFAIASSQP